MIGAMNGDISVAYRADHLEESRNGVPVQLPIAPSLRRRCGA